jgi:tRNA(Arg) A34 adenosine deaminase TadA
MNTSKKEDERYLKEAISEAGKSVEQGGGPFGAVLVKDGKIIARSGNTVTLEHDPTAHAEVNAIREGGRKLGTFDLSGTVIYASAEPCPMCLGAIYWANIDRVVFAASRNEAAAAGFRDAMIYTELALPPEQRHLPHSHLPVQERTVPFKKWQEKEDRTEY